MNKPKVLIVEDETIVALEMKRALEKFDFEVTDTVTNYDSTLNSVEVNKPDIILMDINLENSKDGIEIAKMINTVNNIPIIYITAYTDEETIKRAIETKPVSYLTKPFRRDELKTNILLGLYKSEKSENSYISEEHSNIGLDYYYDRDLAKLFYKDLPIKLSTKESLLLKLLIDAKGELITFEELEYQIWPAASISGSTLRTLIYRLRSKLEHKLIETTPMVGCRLFYKE